MRILLFGFLSCLVLSSLSAEDGPAELAAARAAGLAILMAEGLDPGDIPAPVSIGTVFESPYTEGSSQAQAIVAYRLTQNPLCYEYDPLNPASAQLITGNLEQGMAQLRVLEEAIANILSRLTTAQGCDYLSLLNRLGNRWPRVAYLSEVVFSLGIAKGLFDQTHLDQIYLAQPSTAGIVTVGGLYFNMKEIGESPFPLPASETRLQYLAKVCLRGIDQGWNLQDGQVGSMLHLLAPRDQEEATQFVRFIQQEAERMLLPHQSPQIFTYLNNIRIVSEELLAIDPAQRKAFLRAAGIRPYSSVYADLVRRFAIFPEDDEFSRRSEQLSHLTGVLHAALLLEEGLTPEDKRLAAERAQADFLREKAREAKAVQGQ